MRGVVFLSALALPLTLAACGHSHRDRTVVVTPPASSGTTVVVPDTPRASTTETTTTTTKTCPPGYSYC